MPRAVLVLVRNLGECRALDARVQIGAALERVAHVAAAGEDGDGDVQVLQHVDAWDWCLRREEQIFLPISEARLVLKGAGKGARGIGGVRFLYDAPALRCVELFDVSVAQRLAHVMIGARILRW